MNKILADYIACIRKRIVTNFFVKPGVDVAEHLARETWDELTTTNSRCIIRDNTPLREALAMSNLDFSEDWHLRDFLKTQIDEANYLVINNSSSLIKDVTNSSSIKDKEETTGKSTEERGNNKGGKPLTWSHPQSLFDSFQAFWSAYPKKRNKGDAWKAWKALKADAALREQIRLALERAKMAPDWTKEGGTYIPYPASWLRAQGWEDVHEIEAGQDEGYKAKLEALRKQREALK